MTDLKPEKRGPGRLLPVTWRGVRWSIVVALVLVLVAGLAYPELVSPLSLSLLLVALSSLLLMAAALLGYMFGKQEPSTTNDKGDAPSASKAPNAAAMSASLKTPILLPQGDVVILDVSIRNFRNIADLRLNLDAHSGLGGNWTCIAGLNGAGKSAVLQAVCLLLLGERLTAELGQERLRRMWRRAPGDDLAPELRAHCRIGDTIHEIYLPFSSDGIDRHKLAVHPDAETIFAIWQRLQTQLVTAYGATRNLSDYQDRRYGSLSRQVQRQMTLFDPLTQIANVDVLLQGGTETGPALRTLLRLLRQVLNEADLGEPQVDFQGRLRIVRDGAELDPLDLPDGFRSTVAWLADICAAWHQMGERRNEDPAEITGIVLVDEIDLHLHASLQRSLVPALRKALPRVQFIVTTHSPLILSCFDRRELVILDRASEGGIRTLDRQLFGMSMDDIYQWLMDTSPESPVMEAMLYDADPKAAVLLAQSPTTTEREAEEKVSRRRAFLKRLQTDDKPAP